MDGGAVVAVSSEKSQAILARHEGTFERPVLVNSTRPSAGGDIAFADVPTFTRRMGNNTGNMAFLYAILKTVRNVKHITERSLEESDVKIWGCSNFIAEHREIKIGSQSMYRDGKPFVAIGLGAQASRATTKLTIPQATQEWISKIASMAPTESPNISLRGAYTKKVLSEHQLAGKTTVLGCPSLYINPSRHLGRQIRAALSTKPQFIAVAPGNILDTPARLQPLERALCSMVMKYPGYYVCQHPPGLFELLLSRSEAFDWGLAARVGGNLLPHLTPQEFVGWFRVHARLFDNIPSWLNCLRSVDIVVSARLHGAQLAIQAGTPALCVALDARQVELCDLMRIPYIPYEQVGADFSVPTAYEILRGFDWVAFDENRIVLARAYSDFLRRNKLSPSEHLLAISGEA